MENIALAFIRKWAEGDNSSSEMIIELKNVYKDDEKLFTTNRVLIVDAIRSSYSVADRDMWTLSAITKGKQKKTHEELQAVAARSRITKNCAAQYIKLRNALFPKAKNPKVQNTKENDDEENDEENNESESEVDKLKKEIREKETRICELIQKNEDDKLEFEKECEKRQDDAFKSIKNLQSRYFDLQNENKKLKTLIDANTKSEAAHDNYHKKRKLASCHDSDHDSDHDSEYDNGD